MPRLALAAIAAALLPPLTAPVARAQAADADPGDLRGATTVAVGLGSARQRLGGSGGAATTNTRLLGAARLTHWLRPTWALDLSAARFGPLDDGAVTPVLLGVAWYPAPAAGASRVRPHLGASVGLFVRSLRDNTGQAAGPRTEPARTDAVPGARLTAGVDAFMARRVVLGALAGYHAARRFPAVDGRPQAAATRPAGPMFALTAGLVLPRRGP